MVQKLQVLAHNSFDYFSRENTDSNAVVLKDIIIEKDKSPIQVNEVNNNLYVNHEYMKLKAKLLGKEKIHSYDMSVNTLDVEDTNIEYEDARKIVLDALKPMGEDYIQKLEYAFDNRWLDVYERKNKMTGGYNMGVYGVHPYILLNYVKSLRDVSTIAHELGHAMHSMYSSEKQNVFNSQYTIMVAEVASTVNEILLANYLIERETDNKKKAALITEQLDLIRATLIEQTKLAEFEENVHRRVEAGETLTAENLNEIFFELVKKYAGEALEPEEESKYVWARIPHFYRCFYVYKYATGITSAIVIANKILSGEQGYVEKYKNMLSLGRTKDSIELLKMVDVDLENAETYRLAFKYYEDSLNKLKELLK
jgi:oligoendopeptidase F